MGTRQDFEIACSAEAAFDGFTDAERILGWWHDRDAYRTVKWTSDLKEGGSWRAEFEAQEGSRFGAGGNYVVVERPERLDWTWRADWEPELEKMIRMTFTQHRAGVRMSVETMGHESAKQEQADLEAWSMIVTWFARSIAIAEGTTDARK